MKVIACYPRTMSAWLSGFLTVPHCSLYAHDILSFPDMVQILRSTDYPHLGVVDTAACVDNIPEGAEVTVIDSDPSRVAQSLGKWLGDDAHRAVDVLHERMEALKPHATVHHTDDREDWIGGLFEHHTGLAMDWGRYRVMMNLDIQSRMARRLSRQEE